MMQNHAHGIITHWPTFNGKQTNPFSHARLPIFIWAANTTNKHLQAYVRFWHFRLIRLDSTQKYITKCQKKKQLWCVHLCILETRRGCFCLTFCTMNEYYQRWIERKPTSKINIQINEQKLLIEWKQRNLFTCPNFIQSLFSIYLFKVINGHHSILTHWVCCSIHELWFYSHIFFFSFWQRKK